MEGRFIWGYELITLGEPSKPSKTCPRQLLRQPLVLKRVHLPPTPATAVFRIARPNVLECAIKLPKMVSIKDSKVKLSINLHPRGEKFTGVRKIALEGFQTEESNFQYGNLIPGLRRFWTMQPTVLFPEDMTRPGIVITDPPHCMGKSQRIFTKHTTISNPNKKAAIATWGCDSPIEYELEINLKHLIPTETVEWLKITHGIRLTFSFIDSTINPMMFTAPIAFGNIVQD
ncbi:hypothetical protein BGX26_010737 [Mortierella sp. AD094]|nr:hypothetical protein BGX26_010737 [Mortierella sp. AD094]